MKFYPVFALVVGFALSIPFLAHAAEEGDDLPPPAVTSIDPDEDIVPATAPAAPKKSTPRDREKDPWFRNAGEYLSSRSTRSLAPTDVNTKIITDAKRFDVSLGKRIPLIRWAEDDLHTGWAIGVDGGMLASLVRYMNDGRLTFATNTFDGFFGGWIGFTHGSGWLAMFRTAHLSAHLVDNSPLFANPVAYSQFWNEIVIGKSFPETRRPSDWDLHIQGSVGMNNTATPRTDQPRATLGVDLGFCLSGPDSLAIITSADALRAGVLAQRDTYGLFLGIGYLNRPENTRRPFRAGVAHFTGSDYRNQLFLNRQRWTTLEVATEF